MGVCSIWVLEGLGVWGFVLFGCWKVWMFGGLFYLGVGRFGGLGVCFSWVLEGLGVWGFVLFLN